MVESPAVGFSPSAFRPFPTPIFGRTFSFLSLSLSLSQDDPTDGGYLFDPADLVGVALVADAALVEVARRLLMHLRRQRFALLAQLLLLVDQLLDELNVALQRRLILLLHIPTSKNIIKATQFISNVHYRAHPAANVCRMITLFIVDIIVLPFGPCSGDSSPSWPSGRCEPAAPAGAATPAPSPPVWRPCRGAASAN